MKKKVTLIGLLVLITFALILGINSLMPKPVEGNKIITFKIVDEMNNQVLFDGDIQSDAETLGECLRDYPDFKLEKEDGQYGMYITSLMGVSVHDDAYWVFESENNKSCSGSEGGFCPAADQVMLEDGDNFTFKLTNQFN